MSYRLLFSRHFGSDVLVPRSIPLKGTGLGLGESARARGLFGAQDREFELALDAVDILLGLRFRDELTDPVELWLVPDGV